MYLGTPAMYKDAHTAIRFTKCFTTFLQELRMNVTSVKNSILHVVDVKQ